MASKPTAIVPQIPLAIWTPTAPTGSSICNLRSKNSTTKTTKKPLTKPTTVEPIASKAAHPAVTPTKPAKQALMHIETSGFLFLIQVKIIVVTVATAGAIVVFKKMVANSLADVAAAPLKPYQPNHKMKAPRAPKGIEWP